MTLHIVYIRSIYRRRNNGGGYHHHVDGIELEALLHEPLLPLPRLELVARDFLEESGELFNCRVNVSLLLDPFLGSGIVANASLLVVEIEAAVG